MKWAFDPLDGEALKLPAYPGRVKQSLLNGRYLLRREGRGSHDELPYADAFIQMSRAINSHTLVITIAWAADEGMVPGLENKS